MAENKENVENTCARVENNLHHVFREKNIQIGVDLVDAARKQLVFLREVDKHPDLYTGDLVRKAIRRYEQLWLPLAAEHNGKEIAPPLDVHWVWHVHMLAPYYYEKDCLEIVKCVPDHKLLSDNSRHAAMERAKAIWEDRYRNEPFHTPLDADPSAGDSNQNQGSNSAMCNGYHQDTYQRRSKYDLESASSRQRMFYYQVSSDGSEILKWGNNKHGSPCASRLMGALETDK